jgi:hypothetical protein
MKHTVGAGGGNARRPGNVSQAGTPGPNCLIGIHQITSYLPFDGPDIQDITWATGNKNVKKHQRGNRINLSLRRVVQTAALSAFAGLALPRVARAAEFSFKYGNNLPLTHPLNIRAQEFVDRIAKESNGRIEIRIFPNNQLGGDTDMLSQVRTGGITFFTPSALVIATLVPVAAISAVGFAFTNYDQVWGAMDGELGAYVRAAIDATGLHTFEKIWDNGFRQMTTSGKPIETAADLAGLKIRVPACSSARCIRRCRRKLSMRRKIRCRSFKWPSCTKCRNPAR